MAAVITWKHCTSTNAATETTQTNWNLLATDSTDSGSGYETDKISIPSEGTTYSYERWMRFIFTDTFNLIDNIKCWKSAGTLSDENLTLYCGETDTGVTPVNTNSSIATTVMPTVVGNAIDITPSNSIDTTGEKTDYFVVQLDVPSTVTNPGNIGPQTLSVQYDES